MQGWQVYYSGKSNGFYIKATEGMSIDDIEIAVIQYFGVLPDCKLFMA